MILQYFLNDNTDMVEQVENLIEHNIVMVTPEVIYEKYIKKYFINLHKLKHRYLCGFFIVAY